MFKKATDIFASTLRLKVAIFFVRRPGERAFAEDVASVLGASRDATKHELSALCRAGILKRKKIGRSVSYAVHTSHPLVLPLSRFAIDALIPSDKKIADAFRANSGVMLVVTAGLLKE